MEQGNTNEGLKIKGCYRLQIVGYNEDGSPKVDDDSGWCENTVTQDGFNDFLVKLLGSLAGSKQIGYVALGTGGAPATTDTAIAGEIMGSTKRKQVTAATVAGSKTLRFTATFASSDSFFTGGVASNISNIGLYNTSSGSNLFAGNTYASSALNSNQDVNITYEIRFA